MQQPSRASGSPIKIVVPAELSESATASRREENSNLVVARFIK
jgi:hypothetical protein